MTTTSVDNVLAQARTDIAAARYAEARTLLLKAMDTAPDQASFAELRQTLSRCCALEARAVIDAKYPVPDYPSLRAIIKRLKADLRFALARRLLLRAETPPPHKEDDWVQQQLVLCTYKDEEQSPARRLHDALRRLEKIGLRKDGTTNGETLALGGAIYKRRWEHEGQIEHLYESLAFYLAAFERNRDAKDAYVRADSGYGGGNAAYVIDILAARSRAIERRSRVAVGEAQRLADQATALRRAVAAVLDGAAKDEPAVENTDWFLVTRAEAAFGIGEYKEASQLLSRINQLAPAKQPSEWERQTTFRQLLALARLHDLVPPPELPAQGPWPPPWEALRSFLGEDTRAALSCAQGKVGLALSGGGFRASFFHLGVLARMAELDMLRSVEVLSTVSGGSIVGAAYYLELQRVYESKRDAVIDVADYVAIVRQVQEAFLRGVQNNLRMLALADLGTNLRMVRDASYTRSHRMGELYEVYLYAAPRSSVPASSDVAHADESVLPRHRPGTPRRLRELLITPASDGGKPDLDFKPHFSNWRRAAKVPVLLLNTTSLNSGHLWHFTASFMGEPPGVIDSTFDTNQRYRRLYYGQAPTAGLQDYRLGYAVAASACVPGLFDPLVIDDLYANRSVRLVDGGVHDNQGVAGLLDQGCSLILCSDASGQMEDDTSPPGGLLSPLLRSSQSIFMSRIREAQYQDLRGRVDSRALSGLFFIHLKHGLPTKPVDWIRCDDPTPELPLETNVTKYGIDFDVQRQLAAMRTDLDSFTEVEAYALMLSGYLMTKQELEDLHKAHRDAGESGTWGSFRQEVPSSLADPQWPFLALAPVMSLPKTSNDPRRQDLDKQLAASQSLMLKVWKLYPAWSRRISQAAAVVAVVFVLWLMSQPHPLSSVGGIIATILGAVLLIGGASIAITAWNYLVPQNPKHNYIGKAVAMVGGWLIAQFHLRFFDAKFLRRGELRRLVPDQPG